MMRGKFRPEVVEGLTYYYCKKCGHKWEGFTIPPPLAKCSACSNTRIKAEDSFKAEVFKNQALQLAEHHKKHCDGESCTISLLVLKEMAEKAGVKFTKKELEVFV